MSGKYLELATNRSPYRGGAHTALLILGDAASHDGQVWLSVESLARRARLSERMTQYVLRRLEADGFLEDLGPHSDPRYHGTTVYQMRFPKGAKPPQRLTDGLPNKTRPPRPKPAAAATPVVADCTPPAVPVSTADGVQFEVQSAAPEGCNPGVADCTQSRQPVRQPGGERARATPLPPDDQVDDPDPEARRPANRAELTRMLRYLTLRVDGDADLEEWVGIGVQAGTTSFDETCEAIRWCVAKARKLGVEVLYARHARPQVAAFAQRQRARRDGEPRQAELGEPEAPPAPAPRVVPAAELWAPERLAELARIHAANRRTATGA